MSKPIAHLDWVVSGDAARIVEPVSGLKSIGYSPSEPPASQNHNWIFWNIDQWVKYLETTTDSLLSDITSITGLSAANKIEIDQINEDLPHYASNGDFYEDSGAADAYVVDPTESKTGIDAYSNGDRIRFIPDNTNTSASTVNVNSLGVKSIVDQGGNALTGGEIEAGSIIEMEYISSLGKFKISGPEEASTTWINANTNTGQAITANTTDVPFTNEIDDDDGEWNGTTFAPNIGGDYLITGCMKATGTIGDLLCYKNSSLFIQVGEGPSRVTFSFMTRLTNTDSITLRMSSSVSLDSVNSSIHHWISISKMP